MNSFSNRCWVSELVIYYSFDFSDKCERGELWVVALYNNGAILLLGCLYGNFLEDPLAVIIASHVIIFLSLKATRLDHANRHTLLQRRIHTNTTQPRPHKSRFFSTLSPLLREVLRKGSMPVRFVPYFSSKKSNPGEINLNLLT